MNNPAAPVKKSLLLQLFILLISIANIALISLIYTNMTTTITSSSDNQFKKKKQSQPDYDQNMQNYLIEYGKQQKMFQNFSFFVNYDTIVLKNAKLNQVYKDSINGFSNITQKQFYKLYDIVRKIAANKNFGEVARFGFNYSDWSRKQTIIRDQKGFNTSFIFSALSAIQYRINKKIKEGEQWKTLSAQQIIDCCPQCMRSKRPETVFDYIKKYGVLQQSQYPYQNSRFDTVPKICRRSQKSGKKYFIKGYIAVRNCQALQVQIADGPLVVGLDGRNFPSYQYSIFTQCQRKTTHYATIVGMSYDHWKLQNSWGRKWGQRGYIRIGPGDTCGVCLRGSSPILKQD